MVALLAEGVDRNFSSSMRVRSPSVALLAEGVDRNVFGMPKPASVLVVALLAEGVDRNLTRTSSA